MPDTIVAAMQKYTRQKRTKRGFLLTETDGFFLYDNKFCSISEYDIQLQSDNLSMYGTNAAQPVFAAISGNTLLCAAVPERELCVNRLRLLFHIACGEGPEDLLRGIFLIKQSFAQLALFSDQSVEDMMLALEKDQSETRQVEPFEELLSLQENCNRNDLRLLTELYMKGENWKGPKNLGEHTR